MVKRLFSPSVRTGLVVVLVGIASWAFYQLVNQGIVDLLLRFGVSNNYAQNVIILAIVIVLLVLLGWKGKTVMKKILG